MPFYIVMIAIAPMRAEPDHRSEQVNQARLGEIVELVEEEDGWLKLKLETDGYVGYISSDMVIGFESEEIDNWRTAEKFVFGERSAEILEAPFKSANLIRTAYMGDKLPLISRKGSWVELKLPDGKSGWTHCRQFQMQDAGSRAGIVETAQLFIGAPYLWGGRTAAGFDCSGFVQTVFELNGIDLPRDTAQQIKAGKERGKDHAEAQKGDLLFFNDSEGEVDHIGIYLGEGRFIHSSGLVRVNGLDADDALYEESYLKRFTQVRTIEDLLI